MNAREASTVRASASSRSGTATSCARGRPRTCSSVTSHPTTRHSASAAPSADAVQQRGEQNPHHAAGELVHAHPRRRPADPVRRDVVGHDRLVRPARQVHAELQQQHGRPEPAQRGCRGQRDQRRHGQRDAGEVEPAPVADPHPAPVREHARADLHRGGEGGAGRGERRVRRDRVRAERAGAVLQHHAQHRRPDDLDPEPERAQTRRLRRPLARPQRRAHAYSYSASESTS